jgi:penicillin-binding protein 1C
VIRTQVKFEHALEPTRDDWFLRGTQTPVVRLGACADASSAERSTARAAPRIGAPADGTLFALDPDIPPARQRIAFERASGTSTRSAWRLDGKVLGDAQRVLWLPWPGRHVLELVSADGKRADAVHFEVRGATARMATAAPPAPQLGRLFK